MEARPAKDLQEAALELAEGDLYLAAQDPAELGPTRAVGAASQDRLDHRGRRSVADAGLVAGSSEGMREKAGGMSTRVRATVVIGILRPVVVSRGSR
jgi:hypothetical protein